MNVLFRLLVAHSITLVMGKVATLPQLPWNRSSIKHRSTMLKGKISQMHKAFSLWIFTPLMNVERLAMSVVRGEMVIKHPLISRFADQHESRAQLSAWIFSGCRLTANTKIAMPYLSFCAPCIALQMHTFWFLTICHIYIAPDNRIKKRKEKVLCTILKLSIRLSVCLEIFLS